MPEQPAVRAAGLSGAAAAFEFAVVWTVAAVLVFLPLPTHVGRKEWIVFALLAPVIAVVHLLGAERQKNQGSHLSLAPMFAAALLLPPFLAAAAIALAFLPEWCRARAPWYIVLFNVANAVGPAIAARALFDALDASGLQPGLPIAAVAAVGCFVGLQYAVLGTMLRLARGVRFLDTVRPDCLLIDVGLVSLGASAALLAKAQTGLVVVALLPLAAVYRSLAIPALVEATRIDPKTGLYNMRHFESAFAQELGRAARFGRPIGVLMVDVDHLRRINNTRGHLAGDRALRLVADALREATRAYDVAARFGGDEFCVLLPETDLSGALGVAERVRAAAERFGGEGELAFTVSVGAAAHTGAGTSAEELVALADRAVYRAKFSGRNSVAVPPEGDPVDEAERILVDALRESD
jgi:diguanylate cyclase (GGDEF)-like protein